MSDDTVIDNYVHPSILERIKREQEAGAARLVELAAEQEFVAALPRTPSDDPGLPSIPAAELIRQETELPPAAPVVAPALEDPPEPPLSGPVDTLDAVLAPTQPEPVAEPVVEPVLEVLPELVAEPVSRSRKSKAEPAADPLSDELSKLLG